MEKELPYNEKELVLLIANNDERAFELLIAKYSSILYGHVLSYLKNPAQAEEITQDIFLNIWNLRASLPQIDNFHAYLLRAARNRTISAFRKKMTEDSASEFGELDSGYSTPSESLEYRELSATILTAIDQLPPRRKEVFRMSRIEGKSHEEIAEALSISRSAVNQHIIEALVFLRTHLRNSLPVSILISTILAESIR